VGVARRLVSRGIALLAALIIVVFLTSFMLCLSGRDKQAWLAIIDSMAREYKMSLRRGNPNMSEEEINKLVMEYKQQLIKAMGLDRPAVERALRYAIRLLKLDLGCVQSTEVATIAGVPENAKVSTAIMNVLPRTIIMITVAELICAAIALPLAPYIAYKRGTLLDKFVVSYAAAFNAIPVWWLAMLFIYYLGHVLHVAPTDYRLVMSAIARFWEDPASSLVQILYYAYVPILAVVIAFLGTWFYTIRAIVLRIVTEDFVMVAKAKGLPDNLIARRHILRAALPPIITYTILALATSIGGFIITESVFDWPGMGMLYYAAATTMDMNTLMALIFITTAVYVAARFVLEVLYIILDPRVRL